MLLSALFFLLFDCKLYAKKEEKIAKDLLKYSWSGCYTVSCKNVTT